MQNASGNQVQGTLQVLTTNALQLVGGGLTWAASHVPVITDGLVGGVLFLLGVVLMGRAVGLCAIRAIALLNSLLQQATLAKMTDERRI